MNFLKSTKLYSVLTGTCPVCQEEVMYKKKNPYQLKHTLEMHERCSHCHTKYKIEPSFFYGAMYVSYPVGIAFATAAFVISHLLFHIGLLITFFIITATMVVFLPIIMRISRNIWINIFLHYDKKKVASDLKSS